MANTRPDTPALPGIISPAARPLSVLPPPSEPVRSPDARSWPRARGRAVCSLPPCRSAAASRTAHGLEVRDQRVAILTGLTDNAPIRARWTTDYLQDHRAASVEVNVRRAYNLAQASRRHRRCRRRRARRPRRRPRRQWRYCRCPFGSCLVDLRGSSPPPLPSARAATAVAILACRGCDRPHPFPRARARFSAQTGGRSSNKRKGGVSQRPKESETLGGYLRSLTAYGDDDARLAATATGGGGGGGGVGRPG